MDGLLKILWAILKALLIVAGVLFVVYFWNLDQKLMGWVYVQAGRIRGRKAAGGKS